MLLQHLNISLHFIDEIHVFQKLNLYTKKQQKKSVVEAVIIAAAAVADVILQLMLIQPAHVE